MSDTNEISNAFIEGVSMIAKNAVNKAKITQTITCTILAVRNSSLGTYIAEYLGNSIPVTASNPSEKYSVGESVYVLVPDGDMSKTKVIIGRVQPAIIAVDNDSYTINQSGNLLKDVKENQIYSLNSYEKDDHKDFEIDTAFFDNYVNRYKNLIMSAEFMTDFDTPKRKGNYGVKLTIPFVEGNKEYKIDTYKISGSVYMLFDWVREEISIDLTKYTIDSTKKPSFVFFQTDFEADENKKNNKDIFLRNPFFGFTQILTEEQGKGFYAYIDTNQAGEDFISSEEEEKTLNAVLLYNKQPIESQDIEYYWFCDDATVKDDKNEYYNSYGGKNWKCLNSYTIKDNIVTWLPGVDTYSIKQNDIIDSRLYKCVMVYKDNSYNATICITNKINDNNLTFTLEPYYGSEYYVRGAGDVKIKASAEYKENEEKREVKFIWTRYDAKGSEILDYEFHIEDIEDGQIFSYDTNLIEDDQDLIRCSAYIVNKDESIKMLGTRYLINYILHDATFSVVIKGGNKVFKYDGEGDSPTSPNYNGNPSSRITELEPLSFEIYDKYGHKLDDEQLTGCIWKINVPSTSLLKIDSNKYANEQIGPAKVEFSLANKYDAAADNNITFEVTYDNSKLIVDAGIIFTKDGNQGTNGTKYSAMFTPNYLTYIYKKNGEIISPNFPELRVYADGVSVDSSKYKITYSIIPKKSKFQIENGVIKPPSSLDIQEKTNCYNILQAKVKIDGYELYTYCPIEISSNENYKITDGYTEILYSSDGKNPQYNSPTNIFNVNAENAKWEIVGENLTQPNNNNIISPAKNYTLSNNYVKVTIGDDFIIRPIFTYTDRYGISSINGWDGDRIYIDENDNYIYAPQFGAGKKKDDNSFTGMIMGIQNTDSEQNKEKVGLFGYASGERSIFLDAETGKAEFGIEGQGQIILDPSSPEGTVIKGGTYSTSSGTGMQINLGNSPSINFGSGNFEVNSEGRITAKIGQISSWMVNKYFIYAHKEGDPEQAKGDIVLTASSGDGYSPCLGSGTIMLRRLSKQNGGSITFFGATKTNEEYNNDYTSLGFLNDEGLFLGGYQQDKEIDKDKGDIGHTPVIQLRGPGDSENYRYISINPGFKEEGFKLIQHIPNIGSKQAFLNFSGFGNSICFFDINELDKKVNIAIGEDWTINVSNGKFIPTKLGVYSEDNSYKVNIFGTLQNIINKLQDDTLWDTY